MKPEILSVKAYLKALEETYKTGQASEHSYRPALERLIESIGGSEVDAINEPKRIACGAPDFVITRGIAPASMPIGYIEAKDVGAELNKVERTEQLKRYFDSLGNFILTDYFEFRWYVEGVLRLKAELPRIGRDGKTRWNDEAGANVAQLIQQFLQADVALKSTPKELATRMAGLGRLLRSLIESTFAAESEQGELHAQLEGFRKVFMESLTVAQFADMYAQTLCYGLFAARCNATTAGFTRQSAANALPKTNPFLRKLFNSIAGPDLDDRIAWAVDQLASVLARADIAAILTDFGKRTRQEDPVVHFYETFLAAYDPKMREARGVYYTPEPVVGYIVRSVDALLEDEFGLAEGLAHAGKIKLSRPKAQGKGMESFSTHRVQILDPATGTGTFLHAVIASIRARFDGRAGEWPGYVAEHLLPRLFGFELLMAPYAVAHMKLGLELEATGYDFSSDQRLGVYLTNSLEQAHEMTGLPLFTQWLAEESRAAGNVKRDAPVMVVLGNPPYSGQSANNGAWIAGLLRGYDALNGQKTENYFEVDGAPLGERNPKWLNDDYVKFIRFAQWRIEQTGHGILAFVTNHGYLDNPTFRGMRESLMRVFDDIYVLDLHGNAKKKEKTPDGGKDENVFDIQQGVAIGIFVRKQGIARKQSHRAKVFHHELYGTRADKYAVLDATQLRKTKWEKLNPTKPNYYFVPFNIEYLKEYNTCWKLSEIFPVNSVGIVTARDDLTIKFGESDVWTTVQDFSALNAIEARDKYSLGPDARDWKVALAQSDLHDSGLTKENIFAIAYRPFDARFSYFTGKTRGFHCMPRSEVMRNLIPDHLSLVVSRQTNAADWANVFAARGLVESCLVSNKTSEIGSVFPLWLYPKVEEDLISEPSNEKIANIDQKFAADLTAAIGKRPSPEQVMAYIYAILYAPSYRSRYGNFLKRDFPRVPVTCDKNLFTRLVKAGTELIALHTLDETRNNITKYPIPGSNEVVKVRFVVLLATSAKARQNFARVYINESQYFDAVPVAVWETHIGGYRVAEKWLKDRRGRTLSYDELTHYQHVISALARTLEIQNEIDIAIASSGGWPFK